MSKTVDEKVVEMRFDNKQFENNVQTSISSLDRLKKSLQLEGAEKGFENINKSANNVSFNVLSSSIESLERRFSTFGIVGMRIIENLTDSMMNLANTTISFLTNSIVQGGITRAMNIENAHFMLQGLLQDEDKVQRIMQQASESVDGTAYSYDEAAKAASQFAASGVEEGEQMASALRGITGVAAMTNSEYESISQVFTTVAGNGRLMGDQLLQLSSRGLNAASTLKDFFNGVIDGSKTASESVIAEIKAITGSTEEEIKAKREAIEQEYETQRNAYDKEYQAKKKEFDKSYEALSESLDEQIEATRKANEKIINDVKNAYEEEVEACRKATEEKIALIDKEYEENIKLIDEEKYNRIKAIDDQIKSINDKAEAEEKEREQAEQKQKIAELQKAINTAESVEERTKAEKELADFNASIAQKELAERRKAEIASLNEKKESIKEEAELRKASAKEQRDNSITAVQEEYQSTLKIKQEKYAEEIESLTQSQNEQLKIMQASKKSQLEALKESQSEQLEYFKEVQQKKTAALKENIQEQIKALKTGLSAAEITEADIRKLVSEGKISFDIFSEAMNEAFGDHAKKANETLTGSFANVKAALSRIGAEFVLPLVEQNGALVKFFNALRERINDVKANIGPLANMFVNTVKTAANTATNYLNKLDLTDHFKAFYNIIGAAKNAFKGLWKVISTIRDAYKEIFPPITIKQLVEIVDKVKEFSSNLIMNDTVSKNLKSTFKGLFAVIDIVKQALQAVFHAISPLLGHTGGLIEKILSVTGAFGEWLVKLDDTIRKNDIFNRSIQAVIGFVQMAVKAIQNFAENIREKFNLPDIDTIKESLSGFLKTAAKKVKTPGLDILRSVLDKIKTILSGIIYVALKAKDTLINAINSTSETISKIKIVQVLQAIWNTMKRIAKGIADILGKLLGNIKDKLADADFDGIISIINGISLGGISVAITKFLKSVSEPLEGLKGMLKGVTGILDGVRGCLEAYQTQLKAGVLMKIAIAIGILAASIIALSFIDSEKLNIATGAITVLFAELMGSMAIFSKISGSMGNMTKASAAMIAMSAAVLILASALKKIGSLNTKELTTGMIGVLGLTTILVAAAKVLSKGEKRVIKGALNMVIFSAAIKILASVCKDLSALEWEELAKGLIGVGVLLAEVSVFLRTAKFSGKAITTATGMVILAAAIKVLASSCKTFADMEWEEIGKGLAGIGGLLLEIAAFTKLTGNAKHVLSTGIALIAMGAAMKIFESVLKGLASMGWDEIIRGLTALAATIAALTISLNLMPKGKMVSTGVGLIAVSTALIILSTALKKMSGMSWDEIPRGLTVLAGSMIILAASLRIMKGTLSGSAALLVATAALAVLTPVLKSLGSMSWEEIVTGLLTLAGAFAVIGIAGLVLGPIIPNILALGGAMALIGLGVLGIGTGLIAAGIGLQALSVGIGALGASMAVGATAIVAALSIIIIGVLDLIPSIVEIIGKAIITFCDVIIESMPVIGEAVKETVFMLADVLTECVPVLTEMFFTLLVEVLSALVEYLPGLIDLLSGLLVELIEGLARNLPDIVKAAVDLFFAFFSSIIEAFKQMDTETLTEGLAGIGILAAIMVALSALSSVAVEAMAGVLAMGAVIAELGLLLAAIGLLEQIPGLSWLIGEGGKLLESIGDAIGSFIGGIIGGIAKGVTNQFPKIGSNLSGFMTNMKPFIKGASQLDSSSLDGVKTLAEIILLLTAAEILDGLTSWLTGGSSIADFGSDIAKLGPSLKEFSDSVIGIDSSAVTASANAARVLSEMGNNLPKHGGIAQWFTGDTTLTDFADELKTFGPSIKSYGDSVKGLDGDAVVASANAAKALSDMAGSLPDHGGVVQWFTGDSTLSDFAKELDDFGPSIKSYSDSVIGLDGDAVEASANAGKILSEMAGNLPKHNGLAQVFTGDSTLSDFAKELDDFGPSIKSYSDSVKGLDGEAVKASANAGKVLSGMASNLPKHDGLAQVFTGDSTLSDFAKELNDFGPSIKSYSESVTGIDKDAVEASATAASALMKAAENLPKHDGLVQVFTGDNTLSRFAEELKALGPSLKSYSESVEGIDTDSVTASANAAKVLAELANTLPNVGGLVNWLIGEKESLAVFGSQLPILGNSLKLYSESVDGIKVDSVIASADAAAKLSEMANTLPNVGGLISWFIGEKENLADFGQSLIEFGNYFSEFYLCIDGMDPDILSEVIDDISRLSDITFIDTSVISDFGWSLKTLAKTGISSFVNAFKNADEEMQETVNDMIDKFTNGVNDKKDSVGETFDTLIITILRAIDSNKNYFRQNGSDIMVYLKDGISSKRADVINAAHEIIKNTVAISDEVMMKFNASGSTMIDNLISGFRTKDSSIQNEADNIVINAVNRMNSRYNDFYNSGVHLVQGFINGIADNTANARIAGEALAGAAANGAAVTLDEHSPSKVGYKIGDYFGIGFINAVVDNSDKSYIAGSRMADSARSGLSDVLGSLNDLLIEDIDPQPTIRPVLDLSDVSRKANDINSIIASDRSIQLAAETGIGINPVSGSNIELKVNNTDIIKEMNNLRGDISSLADIIGRMQIIMDTGALVGAIASPINNALGRQSVYERRGI